MSSRPTHDAPEAARIGVDLAPPAGVTLVEGGAEVSVYAGHADGVEVCLFEPGDTAGDSERRLVLPEHAHGWWFGLVPGMGAGQRYGVRVHGAWEPARGLHHNPAKLLLDPYAQALEGAVRWGPEVYGHAVDGSWGGDIDIPSDLDSRAHVPRGVVVDHDRFDWGDDAPPSRSRGDTVLYETHVRNQTMRHPEIPHELRGTYAGLAHPASVEHLTALGVTAVELLPVHAFTHEAHLVRRGLVNHWGYNTLGFHAPHGPYAAATDPQGVVDEVKGMVKGLHDAGIEVILDVVYNHTAEQAWDAAVLSWRGLDQRAYYRLDERRRDVDVTGCGNTLDLRHPVVCAMALDSLRLWVEQYHVDGFRFDLAVALGRGRGDHFDPSHPFFTGLRTDPVLSRLKLIAEPWDLGAHGWRTGHFPPPFMEWNDRFRDDTRRFWVADARDAAHGSARHGVQHLATRLAGSRDLFGRRDRGPLASVNFVTAHDGFTLADLVSYDEKHNEANGEENRDGHGHNASWNHGVEGVTDDPDVLEARAHTARALLGTLVLSAGVPMLTAGDELGRTQGGNNNAYCQDNETTWLDWDLAPSQEDLLATTRGLLAARRALPVLRRREWSLGEPVGDGSALDLEWYAEDGQRMGDRWDESRRRLLQMRLTPHDDDGPGALVVVNGRSETVPFVLPDGPAVERYDLLWDSALPRPPDEADLSTHVDPLTSEEVPARSIRLYAMVRSG
jgi:isoamylase